MPTGITAPVQSGEVADLRTFLLRVARQFGAFVAQRDDPTEDEPRVDPPGTWYRERLVEAEGDLARLQGLTGSEVEEACRLDHEERQAKHLERIEQDAQTRLRYETMIAKVNAWTPAEGQDGVKQYALEQLQDSLKFDTFNDLDSLAPGPALPPTDWLTERVGFAEAEVARLKTYIENETALYHERKAWSEAFYASIPEEG